MSEKEEPPPHHYKDSTPTQDECQDDQSSDLVTTLEEEVGLHEETLSTLTAKLEAIDSAIGLEKRTLSERMSTLEKLQERQVLLRKTRDSHAKIIRDIEGKLRKCMNKLKKKLEDTYSVAVEETAEEVRESSGESNRGADNEAVESISAKKDSCVESVGEEPRNQPQVAVQPVHHDDFLNAEWCTDGPSIPDPLERRCYVGTLLPSIHSPTLLKKLVSLQTKELAAASSTKKTEYNRMLEEEIWAGSCLDPYALICRWTDVGRRLMLPWENANSPPGRIAPANASAPVKAMDPNAVLCPYELTGTCLDPHCTYQHFCKRRQQEFHHKRIVCLPEVRLPPSPSVDASSSSAAEKPSKRAQSGDASIYPEMEAKRQKVTAKHGGVLTSMASAPGDETLSNETLQQPKIADVSGKQEISGKIKLSSGLPMATNFFISQLQTKKEPQSDTKEKASDTTKHETTTTECENPTKDQSMSTKISSLLSQHKGTPKTKPIYDPDSDESWNGEEEKNFIKLPTVDVSEEEPDEEEEDKEIKEESTAPVSLTEFLSARGYIVDADSTVLKHESIHTGDVCSFLINSINCIRMCTFAGRYSLASAICKITLEKVPDAVRPMSAIVARLETIVYGMVGGNALRLFGHQVKLLLLGEMALAWSTCQESEKDEDTWKIFVDRCFEDDDIGTAAKVATMLREHVDSEDIKIHKFTQVFRRALSSPASQNDGATSRIETLLYWISIGKSLAIFFSCREGARHPYSYFGQLLEPLWMEIDRYGQNLEENDRCFYFMAVVGPFMFSSLKECVVEKSEQKDLLSMSPMSHAAVNAMDSFFERILKKILKTIPSHAKTQNESSRDAMYEIPLSSLLSLLVSTACQLGMYPKAQHRIQNALTGTMIFSELLWSQLFALRSSVFDRRSDDESLSKMARRVVEYGVHPSHLSMIGDSYAIRSNPRKPDGGQSRRKLGVEMCKKITRACFDSQEIDSSYSISASDLNLKLIPFSVSLMENVTKLSFPNCSLRFLPETLGSCLRKLEDIDVSHNELTHLPSSICQLTHLKTLNVSFNSLSRLPTQFGKLTELLLLDASHNRITDLPASICSCSKLAVIIMNRNCMSNTPRHLCLKLKHLKQLDLENNPLMNTA